MRVYIHVYVYIYIYIYTEIYLFIYLFIYLWVYGFMRGLHEGLGKSILFKHVHRVFIGIWAYGSAGFQGSGPVSGLWGLGFGVQGLVWGLRVLRFKGFRFSGVRMCASCGCRVSNFGD